MAAFEAQLDALRAEGIAPIAVSVDPREHAAGTARDLGLSFPVGFGLPLRDTATRLGAYYHEGRGILHATGFLVRPDGTVAVAVYSSGAIGRLLPTEVLGVVTFWKSKS